MNILIIDNGTSFLAQLQSLVPKDHVVVTPFQKLGGSHFDKYDLIILSGGHKYAVMSHRRKYARELRLITESNKPIIGICLGFELIVTAFGGTLKMLRHKIHNQVTVEFTGRDALSPQDAKYSVFERHQRGVKHLPPELIALGRSANGIEIIKHANRPIYAFQFHPEMNTRGEGGLLIERAISLLTSKP